MNRATTPEERARVIAELAKEWELRPQLRIGQLICALAARAIGLPHPLDPFYVEDFDLLPGAK